MVSDMGNVVSINYRRGKTSKLLSPGSDKKGYLTVVLCKNKVKTTRTIHRLVAETFIGVRPDGHVIDHINGISYDNRAENLRYCTNRQNLTFRNSGKVYKSKFPGVYLDPKRVKKYRVRMRQNGAYKLLGSFKTLEEAIVVAKEINY